MGKRYLAFSLFLLLSTVSARAEESFSVFAGSGLSHSRLNYGSTQSPRFIQNAFVMGAEYAYRADNSLFSFSGSFITNDSMFLGLGLNVLNVRITGRIGLGLKNSEIESTTSSEPTNKNYGTLYGLGAEYRINQSLGLSINQNSNSTVGGIVFYW